VIVLFLDQTKILNNESVDGVAHCWSLSKEALSSDLSTKVFESKSKRGSKYNVPLKQQEAIDSRNALSKGMEKERKRERDRERKKERK